MILTVVDRHGIRYDLTRFGHFFVSIFVDGNDSVIRLFDLNGIRRDQVIFSIVRILDISFIFDDGFISVLHCVSILDVNRFTGHKRCNGPGTISIVSILITAFSCDFTNEVVMVGNQQIGYGGISGVGHTDRVSNNLINLRDMLIGFFLDVNGRFRVFHDCCIQNLRCIAVNYHISEAERYIFTGLNSVNRISMIAIICDSIHPDKVQRAIAIEEILNNDIFFCLSTDIADGHSIVERVTDLGFRLIDCLGNHQFAFRNFGLGFVTRNFDFNFIGRIFLIGFVRIITRNMCSSHVLQNVGVNVGNLHRIGVMYHDALTSRNTIDQEFTILEGVAGTVNAFNDTSKVVGISQADVLDIMVLTVMDRHGIRYDLTRFGDGLISIFVDSDGSIIRFFNVNRIGRDSVILAIMRIFDLSGILDNGSILTLHGIGIHNFNNITGFHRGNGPGAISIVDVFIGALGVNITDKVVVIGNQQIGHSFIRRISNTDRVRYDFINLCDMLIGFFLDVNRRVRFIDYNRVQDFWFVSIHHNVCVMEFDFTTSRNICNRIGAVAVICHTIHRDKDQSTKSTEEFLDADIFGTGFTIVRYRYSIVQGFANFCFFLINRFGNSKVRNLSLSLITRNFYFYFVRRNIFIRIQRFIRVNTMTGIVRIFGILSGNVSSCDIFQDMSGDISNFNCVGIRHGYRTTVRDHSDMEFAIFKRIVRTINTSDFSGKVVRIGNDHIIDIKALIVGQCHLICDNFARFGDMLVSFLMDRHCTDFRNNNFHRIRRQLYRFAILAVTYSSFVFKQARIRILYFISIGNGNRFSCLNDRNIPDIVSNVSILVAFNRSNSPGKVIVIRHTDVRLRLRVWVIDVDRIRYDLIHKRELLISRLFGFQRRTFWCRSTNSSVQYLWRIAFLDLICEMQVNGCVCREFFYCVGSITIDRHTNGRNVMEFTHTAKEIFNENVLQFTVTDISNRNGIVQDISNSSLSLIYSFGDLQLALWRINRGRNITARNLYDHFIGRFGLFCFRRRFFVSEPIMQGCNIFQFVVRIGILTSIDLKHNVIVLNRHALTSRNHSDVDLRRTRFRRFQFSSDNIRDDAIEIIGICQIRADIINIIRIDQRYRIVDRISDLCHSFIGFLDDDRTITFRRRLFWRNRDNNLIRFNDDLALIRRISHIGLVDQLLIILVFCHYSIGVDDFYTLIRIHRRDQPFTIAQIRYSFGIFGRNNRSGKVIGIFYNHIRQDIMCCVCDCDRISYRLIYMSDFLISFLNDFRILRLFNCRVVYDIAVAFQDSILNRNVERLPCCDFRNRKGLCCCVVGVTVSGRGHDISSTAVVISNDHVRYRQCAVIRYMDRVMNCVSDTHAGFCSGFKYRHITFRRFTDMYGFIIRVARDRIIIWIPAFCNCRVDDVAIFEVRIFRHDMIHIADFNGFSGIQTRNYPFPDTIKFVITGIFNRTVTIRCVCDNDRMQIRVTLVADFQRIGHGCIGFVFVQFNECAVGVLFNDQFIAQDDNIFRIRFFLDILVTRDVLVRILRSVRRSDVVNHVRVSVSNNVQILNRNAFANVQARNRKQSGFRIIGVSIARSHDKHANSIGVILYRHILHVDRAVIGDDQLICDDLTRICILLIRSLDNRQMLIGKRYDNFIGFDRRFRHIWIFARRDHGCSRIFQLLVREIFCYYRITIRDRYGAANTQRRDRPCSVFIYGITEMEQCVFNRRTHEIVIVADDYIIQGAVSGIGDFQCIGYDIPDRCTLFVGALFNRQILTNDLNVNIGGFNKPFIVRITVFGNFRTIRSFRISEHNIHIGDFCIVDENIIVIGAMIVQLHSICVGECHGIGMVIIAFMRQLSDNKLAVLRIVCHIIGLSKYRIAEEVVGVFDNNIVQVMVRRIRYRYRVADHIVIRRIFAVRTLFDRDLFLVIDSQRTIDIFDVIVRVAAGVRDLIDDNRIARNVRAATDFGLRTCYGNGIHHVMNAKGFIINEFRGVRITRIRQRSSIINLRCRICRDNNRARINIELTRRYRADQDIRNRIICRDDRICGRCRTHILTRNTFCIKMHGAFNVFFQFFGCFIRFIRFVHEFVCHSEILRIVVAIDLAIIFCLDIDNQRQDFEVSVNVDEVIIRIAERGFFCRDRIITNRTPLFSIRIGYESFFSANVIDRIATFVAGDRYLRNRIIFAEILLIIQYRHNDGCGSDRQSTGRRNDLVVSGRVIPIDIDRILANLFPFIRIGARTFNRDHKEIFIARIYDLFWIRDLPGQRIGIRFTINFRLVIGLDMDRFLADCQITANIDELIVAVLRDQSSLRVIDRIVTDLCTVRHRISCRVIAIQRCGARNDGFVILDTSARHILNVTSDKAGHGIGEFRDVFTIGGAISTIDFYSNGGRNDLQRPIIHSYRVVRVRCVVASCNEVVSVIQRCSPFFHRHGCRYIAAYDVFTSSTVQLDVQRTIFWIDQTNDVTGIIFIMEGESRIGSAVSFGLVIDTNDDSLGVDGDITIDITDHIVLFIVRIDFNRQVRSGMFFPIFQNNAIRVYGIFVVGTGSNDILSSVRHIEAQRCESDLSFQCAFLCIFTLESADFSTECRIFLAIGLGISALYSNCQLCRSNREVTILNDDLVVLYAVFAIRADIGRIDGVRFSVSILTSPNILAFLTIDVSAFQIARLHRYIGAFLIGQHRTSQIFNVEVSIVATNTVMDRIGQSRVRIAINLRVVICDNRHRTRNDRQRTIDDGDLIFIIQRTRDTRDRNAILIRAGRRCLRIQVPEGNGVCIDSSFFRSDLYQFPIFCLIHMICVFGRSIVEPIDAISVIAGLIIYDNDESLTLYDQVVCVVVFKVVVRVIQFKLCLLVWYQVLRFAFLRRRVYRIRSDFLTWRTNQVEYDRRMFRIYNNRGIRNTASIVQDLRAIDALVRQRIC